MTEETENRLEIPTFGHIIGVLNGNRPGTTFFDVVKNAKWEPLPYKQKNGSRTHSFVFRGTCSCVSWAYYDASLEYTVCFNRMKNGNTCFELPHEEGHTLRVGNIYDHAFQLNRFEYLVTEEEFSDYRQVQCLLRPDKGKGTATPMMSGYTGFDNRSIRCFDSSPREVFEEKGTDWLFPEKGCAIRSALYLLAASVQKTGGGFVLRQPFPGRKEACELLADMMRISSWYLPQGGMM